MKPALRNILAVLAGIAIGSIVNMTIVNIGPRVIPLPEGADVSSMEALANSMTLFSPADFIAPFLAHAMGTLVGAFITAKLAATRNFQLAMGVGVFFLLGGITAVVVLGGPWWFKAADLLLAYLPMAYLGARLAGAGELRVSPEPLA